MRRSSESATQSQLLDRNTGAGDPLISVVTPFYNTEAYLERAIETVLSQSYGRFEYLLLNNRSQDGSLAIAEKYATLDPRIRVVTNAEFLDQDRNFSEALRLIAPAAKYAKVVLADDWLFPGCLEAMVKTAEANPSAGIVSGYRLKGTELMGDGLPWDTTFLTGNEAARRHLQDGLFLFGSPTTLLYRADVVRKTFPFYQSGVPHADTEACYRTLRDSDFAFVHQLLSYSRVEPGSVSGRIKSYFPDYLDKLIVVRKFGRDFLSNHEYRTVDDRVTRAYLRRLGAAWLVRREPSFWEYHRAGLAAVGIELHELPLWRYGIGVIGGNLVGPVQAGTRALRRALRRKQT